MACMNLKEVYEGMSDSKLDVNATEEDRAKWLLQNNTDTQEEDALQWKFRETGFLAFANSLSTRLIQYARINESCDLECVGLDLSGDLKECATCLSKLPNNEDMAAYYSMTNIQKKSVTKTNIESAMRCMNCNSLAYDSISSKDIKSARKSILNAMIRCTEHNESDTRKSSIWIRDNLITIISVLIFTSMIAFILYIHFKKKGDQKSVTQDATTVLV